MITIITIRPSCFCAQQLLTQCMFLGDCCSGPRVLFSTGVHVVHEHYVYVCMCMCIYIYIYTIRRKPGFWQTRPRRLPGWSARLRLYSRHRLNGYLAQWVPSPPGKHAFQNCMS